MWLVMIKSIDGRYIQGGEIYKKPSTNIYSAYYWNVLLKSPIRRKRIPNRMLCKWAIHMVGPNKSCREFDTYDKAEKFLILDREINSYDVIEL